jgi:5-hydroxyisourate hydrolase-like protein (transthyretin family)
MTRAAPGLSLSLHVLDTARGQAGAGLSFSLVRISPLAERLILAEGSTDGAGRWALDPAVSLEAGVFEFNFAVEAYQARFGTPGFSTYRGG